MELTNLSDGFSCNECGERGSQSDFLPHGWCIYGRQEPCPHTETDQEFLQISVSDGEVFVCDQSGTLYRVRKLMFKLVELTEPEMMGQ